MATKTRIKKYPEPVTTTTSPWSPSEEDVDTISARIIKKQSNEGALERETFITELSKTTAPYGLLNSFDIVATTNGIDWTALAGQKWIVDGIIGAGKTTFIENLQLICESHNVACVFFEEPVDHDALSLFLSDKSKYAFWFQMHMLRKRQDIYLEALKKAEENYFVVIDRGLFGDMAFELTQTRLGNISEEEHQYYISQVDKFGCNEMVINPDKIIFLSVTPETSMERIRRRNRLDEKKEYTLEYIVALDTSYRELYGIDGNIKPSHVYEATRPRPTNRDKARFEKEGPLYESHSNISPSIDLAIVRPKRNEPLWVVQYDGVDTMDLSKYQKTKLLATTTALESIVRTCVCNVLYTLNGH